MQLEEMDLYLTNRCNLSCDFCSVQARSIPDELPLSKIISLVEEAISMGLQDLHLTGGEPTLYRELEEVVSYAVKRGLHVRLITNGTTLSSKRLQKLYSLGLESIMVSLDGNSKYHNTVRGEKAFEKAISTVKQAILLGMSVRVNSVAWRDNKESIIQLMNETNSLGVQVHSIFLGSPLGYASDHKENVMNYSEWREFTEAVRIASSSWKMRVVIEKGFLYPEDTYDITNLQGRGRGCFNLTKHADFIIVKSNGDVYPCVFFCNEAIPMGNINNSSLRDIIEHFADNSYYDNLGSIPSECNTCVHSSICRGGCRGYAKLYTNCWENKDPRCDVSSGVIPVCPIVKLNICSNILGGSSEQVLK